jgi:acyl carrier protein
MREKILATIRETFPARGERITGETPLEEVIGDSIDAVELIAVLSSEYGVRFDPGDLAGIRTVADVVRYVEQHAGETAANASLDGF